MNVALAEEQCAEEADHHVIQLDVPADHVHQLGHDGSLSPCLGRGEEEGEAGVLMAEQGALLLRHKLCDERRTGVGKQAGPEKKTGNFKQFSVDLLNLKCPKNPDWKPQTFFVDSSV